MTRERKRKRWQAAIGQSSRGVFCRPSIATVSAGNGDCSHFQTGRLPTPSRRGTARVLVQDGVYRNGAVPVGRPGRATVRPPTEPLHSVYPFRWESRLLGLL